MTAQALVPKPTTPAIVLGSPIDAEEMQYRKQVAIAVEDSAAVENVEAWHKANDEAAVQGLGYKRRALERRTIMIPDRGIREAGKAFLAAIDDEWGADGEIHYSIDRTKLVGIDEEKLKRWAAIALTVLSIAEPFVPPPYNLGVHAAIMLLKLYLGQPIMP